MDSLLQRASKAFFPFNRSEMPDSRLDNYFASCIQNKHPREHLRAQFAAGCEHNFSEAFRRLRQLDILNRVKPQVAAMCAPVERPADLAFNVGQMCTTEEQEWAGVILAWDETPVKQPGHGANFNPLDLAVHKDEPFYYVICNHATKDAKEPNQRLRYVPQSKLRLIPTWEEFQSTLQPNEKELLQKWLGYFFEGRPCETSDRLEPNPHLRRRYPDTI
eukprot:EG_transcript_18882